MQHILNNINNLSTELKKYNSDVGGINGQIDYLNLQKDKIDLKIKNIEKQIKLYSKYTHFIESIGLVPNDIFDYYREYFSLNEKLKNDNISVKDSKEFYSKKIELKSLIQNNCNHSVISYSEGHEDHSSYDHNWISGNRTCLICGKCEFGDKEFNSLKNKISDNKSILKNILKNDDYIPKSKEHNRFIIENKWLCKFVNNKRSDIKSLFDLEMNNSDIKAEIKNYIQNFIFNEKEMKLLCLR